MRLPIMYFILLLLGMSCTEKSSENTPKETMLQTYHIGQKSYTWKDTTKNRPMVTEVWYPTSTPFVLKDSSIYQKAVFQPIEATVDAQPIDKKFPLLLVSHGTGGNRFSLTWFVDKMVKEGYVVVSVDHFGNSTWNKIPREFVKWWERAIDMQYVLDQVLLDSELSKIVDSARIGGVGFSLGGYTHIALAGGYVDRSFAAGQPLPAEFPKTDEVIDFASDKDILTSYVNYKNKVKDPRIKAFFTIAPAIGFGFVSKEQTKEITAPVMIVAGKGDTNTPVLTNAMVFDSLIETSTLHLFDEYVNHYTFLNEGTALGKRVIPELVTDHPNIKRGDIHAKTVDLAKTFFAKHLQ